AHTAGLDSSIADVDGEAVAAVLRGAGVSRLVHGHTHRPAIHSLTIDSRACSRIVLGDWHSGASVLRWSAAGPDLAHLPRRDS
ncbi:MAG: UDP-2,3-diacylglucosamine diphosphatase, partial [Pseudomonadota bacterium]|nr:UDP-2,3-diacylglucosamine diphosphatase [Pseudomonadota bacterium]